MHRQAFKTPQRILSGGRAAFDKAKSSGGVTRWPALGQTNVQSFSNEGGGFDENKEENEDRPAPKERSDESDRGHAEAEGADGGRGNFGRGAGGRGRGAFSNFLLKHERSLEEHSKYIPESPRVERPPYPPAVSGQFDDAPGAGRSSMSKRYQKQDFGEENGGEDREDDWVKKWFDQVVSEEERNRPDPDADDDYDDVDDLEGVEYSKDIWWVKDAGDFADYKQWERQVFKSEAEQIGAIQEQFNKTKEEHLANGGDVTELELPDIVVTTDIVYHAPPGTATVDRRRPMPRNLETILQSKQLPEGLDITPEHPEYEEIVNYWTTISQNNTYDERMKREILSRLATFINKHRDSKGFEFAISVKNIRKKKKKKKAKQTRSAF